MRFSVPLTSVWHCY